MADEELSPLRSGDRFSTCASTPADRGIVAPGLGTALAFSCSSPRPAPPVLSLSVKSLGAKRDLVRRCASRFVRG